MGEKGENFFQMKISGCARLSEGTIGLSVDGIILL